MPKREISLGSLSHETLLYVKHAEKRGTHSSCAEETQTAVKCFTRQYFGGSGGLGGDGGIDYILQTVQGDESLG